MGLFTNKEMETKLKKLQSEVRFLKEENQNLNEEKSVLLNEIRERDGILSKEDSINDIMWKQNRNRYLRLKNMRHNLSDVLNVARELINYIQFMQNSFDQVSKELNHLSLKSAQAENLSKAAKEIHQVLNQKSQEIQIALTQVADNAHKTRLVAKNASLKAAKMGQFAHEFADIAGTMKDSSDETQINAKRAKGAFSKFTMSMDSSVSAQEDVGYLTEDTKDTKDIELIVERVSAETESKIDNISCMLDKAANGLRKMDSELFINQVYLTVNSKKNVTKANPSSFDGNTPISLCERHLHEDAERIANIIKDAPVSLEVLKNICQQIEDNSLEMFSLIDKENQEK
jgi:uncharacterized protein YoxC